MDLADTNFSELRSELSAWYRANLRALPWRTDPSLYRTVVSEFMCQQTQIDTVLPYFHRWMEALPDFEALAQAPQEEILRAWEGLGYYSRARNLHRLAQIAATWTAPPRTAAEWIRLPGIGPYTAAAIASIAFGEPVPVVDGNVVRVLSRLTASDVSHPSNQYAVKAVQPLAARFLDPMAPGDHNQAVMELGALICRKQKPACLICPLRKGCKSAGNDPESRPRIARRATIKVEMKRLWIERDGALLLRKAAQGERLASLCQLPADTDLPDAVIGEKLFQGTRAITHHRITETIHRAELPAEQTLTMNDSEWLSVPLDQLEKMTLSGPHRRWITHILRFAVACTEK